MFFGSRGRSSALLIAAVATASALACSDKARERLEDTTQPTYDPRTGRLKELTYDANGNGRVDTWTEMDGARPVRSRLDRDEDGTIDRWEYYDTDGRLMKVGVSRTGDPRPDAWAYPDANGAIGRMEISSTADEARIDRWERFAAPARGQERGLLVSAEEDTNRDGRPDKWETYQGGQLETVAFDENHDGAPDRRLTYASGALVLIETQPDATGAYSRRVPVK